MSRVAASNVALPTRIDTSAGTWLRIDYDAGGVPTQVTDSSGTVSPVLSMGRSEPPTRVAKGPVRSSRAAQRNWLERLPLPAVRAQPMPALQQIITRGLSSGLPISQVRPVDPFEPGRCCGGAPQSQSFRFGSDFNSSTMAPPMLAYSVATSVVALAANDILIWKSARKLKKNMLCAGVKEPSHCYVTHHIVHRRGYHPAAERSRQILAQVGIDLDDAVNGLFMECSRHDTTKSPIYDQWVNDQLESVAIKTWVNVVARLRWMGHEIQSGRSP